MERRRDCEEQSSDRPEADAFLRDNKHISGWADSRQLKEGGTPENALSSSPRDPTHRAGASFTCRALRAAPPPLAGVGSHRELDPQRLAAAGGVVDGGVHDLVDGVEQAGDILEEEWEVEVKWNLGLFFIFLFHLREIIFRTSLDQKSLKKVLVETSAQRQIFNEATLQNKTRKKGGTEEAILVTTPTEPNIL